MRLLLVTPFFPAHGGGLERVALELARQFAACDVRVTWISSDSDAPPDLGPNVRCLSAPTNNFIERRTQLPYPLWSPRSLTLLWKLVGAADVVQVHEHLYACSIVAVLLARLRGRPVIITQHMGALRLRSRLGTAMYTVGARALGLVMFRLASGTAFISANVRHFFGLDRAKSAALIYNGVNLERFGPGAGDKPALRAKLALPAGSPLVLFVGRLVRKKGLRVVEALARRMPEVQWVVVGSGPEEPAPSPHGNLILVGRVPNERLPDYYRAADILFLPSSGEGFPLVVQEALCCGTGVLSSGEVASACPPAGPFIRVGPSPGAATEEEGWEVAARETLADFEYLCDTTRRAASARALWSWSDCAARYLKWFAELCDTRKST